MEVINNMIVYHRTNSDNLKSILNNGLLRNKSTMMKGLGGVVYLSRIPNTDFGKAIFEVNISKEKYPECYDLSDWEVICFHDIKKEDIKHIEVN